MTKLNIDCLRLIFNQLDKNSLHSCLLVNKKWCNIVVPILWKEYSWYGNSVESEKNLFNTTLSCLSSSSKRFLSGNGIELPSTILLKPPLFNYVSLCKFPEDIIINRIIKVVFEKEFNSGNLKKINLLEQEIYKLFISQCNNMEELVWRNSQPLPLFPGASTCFSQLYNLYIDIDFVSSNILHEMAQICKDLNELVIENCFKDLPGLISLLDVQRNLKSVAIYPNLNKKETCKELGKTLARKSNTIIHLYLGSVSIIPLSFLTSFLNLKSLSISNNEGYEDTSEEIKYLQQYLAILEFPDLEYLNVYGLSCFKELAMLIEKTKGNISFVHINPTNNAANNMGMLIKAIANNCPEIKSLSIYLESKDFIHVKLLLLNCRQLKSISFDGLDFSTDENDNVGDELLYILTKFSSNSLIEISISRGWNYSILALTLFFESCRGRTLSYFGLSCHDYNYITEDHVIIIKKYIKEGVIEGSDIESFYI